VVWQGSAGDRGPYADQITLSQAPRRGAPESTRMLTAGALVDRVLRFFTSSVLTNPTGLGLPFHGRDFGIPMTANYR
jgi:hypothetical protein